MKVVEELDRQCEQLRGRFLVAGILGAVGLAIGWLLDPHHFFRSYLVAYLFVFGVTTGSLAILMLHHMVGGGWGFVIRRILEASTRTYLAVAALFLPLLFGVHDLYEWAHPEAVANDALLQHKEPYLNVTFWTLRAVLYFAFWIGWAYVLNLRSVQQDRTGDPAITRRLQLISGPGIVLMGAAVTFSSVDWAMSLEPHWFSTMYGLIFLESYGLAALAFAVVCLRWLRRYEPLATIVTPKHFHDLGNLLLAFVMLWAYLNVSQYLIVWSGNLPEETPWYIRRTEGGWEYVAIVLVVFHFALPFALLLSRSNKQRAATLGVLAVALLTLRAVDLFFLIVPGTQHDGGGFHVVWTDPVAFLALGGLWLAVFCHKLKDRALLPVNDPRLEEAFGGGAVDHG